MVRNLFSAALVAAFLVSFSVQAGSLVDGTLSGKVQLNVEDVLPDEDNNFEVDFSLEDGGSVTLHTNTEVDFTAGIKLVVSRKGKVLDVKLVTSKETYNLSGDFAEVDATTAQSWQVDVHGHGHVMIDGVSKKTMEYSFSGKPKGKYWQVLTDKASLKKAVAAKVKHGDH